MEKELTPVQAAFENFRSELRNAILNETIEMTFEPYSGPHSKYFAEVSVHLDDVVKFNMTVATEFVCILDKPLHDLFEGEDFIAFRNMVKKHVKVLTDADKQRIRELEDEIDTIKHKCI